MPLFGARAFVLRIPGAPTGGVLGKNKIVWHDEFLATEIGQVGTQFDGLGHIGVATGEPGDKATMRFYNGINEAEMAAATGLQKLGVEKVKPLVTRGIVLDIAGLKGRACCARAKKLWSPICKPHWRAKVLPRRPSRLEMRCSSTPAGATAG
jgi:hypothetical protein